MQIVPSTFLALIAIAALLRMGPRNGLGVFLALTPLGAAAAFNLPAVGGASIMLVQLAVVAVVALVCLTPGGIDRLAGTLRPGQPGFWMALLLLYCIFSALFAARVFQGATEVFSVARSANKLGIVSVPLRPSAGNITQLFVMVLSVLSFLAFATLFRVTPDRATVMKAMAAATIVHVGLGWIDVASHAVGADWLLDPLRTANYAILDDHRMIGLKRMVGGFAEASSFGSYSVGIFAFWLLIWLSGPTTPLQRWMLFLSLVAVLRSTSSGAYVSVTIFLLLTGGWLLATSVRTTMSRRVALVCVLGIIALWVAAMVVFGAYHFSDTFEAFLDRSILTKLESSSGIERMSWNTQAFQNFLDTALLGAGLGSVRASNWALASLGSLGIPGTLLFLIAMVTILRAGRNITDPAMRSTLIGLKGAGLGSVRASNWALASLGSLGIPGTLLFLIAMVTILRAGRNITDPAMRSTLIGLKAACIGLFLNDLLTAASPVPSVLFATMAGIVTGLARGVELENPMRKPLQASATAPLPARA